MKTYQAPAVAGSFPYKPPRSFARGLWPFHAACIWDYHRPLPPLILALRKVTTQVPYGPVGGRWMTISLRTGERLDG